MKVNIIALCSLFACQNVPAIKEKETIKYYLSQYENFKHFDLKNLNQNVTDILIEIASDPNEKRFYRERALGALQDFQEERVFDFLANWRYEQEPFLSVAALSSLASVSNLQDRNLLAQKLGQITLDTARQQATTTLQHLQIQIK